MNNLVYRDFGVGGWDGGWIEKGCLCRENVKFERTIHTYTVSFAGDSPEPIPGYILE